MSSLNQIQCVYQPEEDRLLLRLNTMDKAEYRFWITRRMISRLWPALIKSLAKSPQISAQPAPAAKEALLAFKQEKAASETDFKTPYRNDACHYPLGEAPILVARIQIKPGPKDSRVLGLHPPKGSGIELGLNEATLHSICVLLSNKVKEAEWGIELKVVAPGALVPETDPSKMN